MMTEGGMELEQQQQDAETQRGEMTTEWEGESEQQQQQTVPSLEEDVEVPEPRNKAGRR